MLAQQQQQQGIQSPSIIKKINSRSGNKVWLQDVRLNCSAESLTNSAIAGYVAGVSGVVFGHPLDSAKVWIQTNSAGRNRHLVSSLASTSSTTSTSVPASPSSSPSMSMARRAMQSSATPLRTQSASMSTLAATAASSTRMASNTSPFNVSFQTIRALYSGIGGPLVFVGIIQCANFTCYDAMRRTLHRGDVPKSAEMHYLNNDLIRNVALAGFVTGGALAFITSPLVMIKTKQQVTGDSFLQVLRTTLRPTAGTIRFSSFFSGFAPHFVSESFGRAVYYSSYEYLKRSLSTYKQRNNLDDGSLSIQERMACAGSSGIACWAMIFPFDSVRSRMMAQGVSTTSAIAEQKTTLQMVRHIYHENGSSLRAFYRGFGLTVLRAGPVAAAVLPIYDLVLEKLQG